MLYARLWRKAEAITVEVPKDRGQHMHGQPIKGPIHVEAWSVAFLCLGHLHWLQSQSDTQPLCKNGCIELGLCCTSVSQYVLTMECSAESRAALAPGVFNCSGSTPSIPASLFRVSFTDSTAACSSKNCLSACTASAIWWSILSVVFEDLRRFVI